MFNNLISAIIAACRAYEEYCKTKRMDTQRELRAEQVRLREASINASRSANSTLLDELQNQLEASYADSKALRDAGSN